MIPFKIKFGRVTLQVVFTDVVKRAIQAALQNSETRLYSVCRHVATIEL